MTSSIESLAGEVLATRRGLWRRRPLYEPWAPVSPRDVEDLTRHLGMALPADLAGWLLAMGYGDLNRELSFRREWFGAIASDEFDMGATFAQDVLGNFYAFDSTGAVYFLSRSEPVAAVLATSFLGFMADLARRRHALVDWVRSIETRPCTWHPRKGAP